MTTSSADAWAAHADELARWAWNHLVIRTDARGGYRPPEEWDREYRPRDGTIGKLGRTTTRKGQLTPALLARHFRARSRDHILGLHSTNCVGVCRWGGIDIDWHGPTSTAPGINSHAAVNWYKQLVDRGLQPLLVDSNGAGGYHLWVVLDRPAPSARVFHFLKQLTSDYARYGMTVAPECFPKQAVLRPRRDGRPSYGNWLRLPGKHHSRDYWSEICCGTHWLAGQQAVEFLLAMPANPVELLPQPPPPMPVSTGPRIRYQPGDDRQVSAYLAKLPHLGEGMGRDNVAYRFACFLVRTLTLSDDAALSWLQRWDAGNATPKGEERLREIITNAHNYGRNPLGCGKPQPRGPHS